MPPSSTQTVVTSKTLPGKGSESCGILQDRKIELDFKQIWNDLRSLDYSKVVWKNVAIFSILHTIASVGCYFCLTGRLSIKAFTFNTIWGIVAGLGVTMGSHRLWAHRSYRANLPLRIILAFAQTLAIQDDIWTWSRDHRVHHKFSETDADPHNPMRGLFYSHIGWLLYKKHPLVKEKGKTVDLSDLLEDPVVYYQRKFYIPLVLILSVYTPVLIPIYFWNETLLVSVLAWSLRYAINLNLAWLVNSFAHRVGSKPYDKHIYPVDNKIVAALALGEGWHNYHHVFPYDYRTGELGGHLGLNFTSLVIELFAKIGWAYNLNKVSKETIHRRMERTGERSQHD